MGEFFYNPIRQDIRMVKNDTLTFAFEIQGLQGQSPTGIYFTVKKSPEDVNPVFQHKIGNGINIVDYDPVTDVLTYRLRIPPKSTQDLDVGRYFYDLEANVNKDTITLLKGMLDIEFEITRKINEDPHDEEDGDVKYYPVSSPSGKLYYTELYISQIAEAIEEKLGIDPQELNKYRTSEMPQAIRSIETGVSLKDFINLNIDAIMAAKSYAKKTAFSWLPDNTHFVIFPWSSDGAIYLGFNFRRGGFDLYMNTNGNRQVGNLSSWSSSHDNFYPYLTEDYSFGSFTLQATKISDYVFKNFPTRLRYEDNTIIHPYLLSKFGNSGSLFTFADIADDVTFTDLMTLVITNVPNLTELYIYKYSDETYHFFGISPDDEDSRFYYDTNAGALSIAGHYASLGTMDPDIVKPTITLTSNTPGAIRYFDVSDLPNKVMFNTEPVKDQNGNILLEANCTLSDFGII